MARTKQTAKKSTGGRPPVEMLAAQEAAKNKLNHPAPQGNIFFKFVSFWIIFPKKKCHLSDWIVHNLFYCFALFACLNDRGEEASSVEARDCGTAGNPQVPEVNQFAVPKTSLPAGC